MAIKKSELYSSLWSSCDELRGGMDASQYKDYVLVLLFVKYVSDKYAGKADAPIEIPKGGSFKDMVALRGQKNIGDSINTIISTLADANDLKGVIDVADFNDENKLGKGKEMQDRLSNLVGIFENPALDFSKNLADGDDILGDAYEYLMRHFATESGKSKGQFYTPAEISRIIAKVIGIQQTKSQEQTIYDPTCGSGSLLLKAADEALKGVTIYGQEMDNATRALSKMNMILHGHPTSVIEQGNTLADPQFKQNDGSLKTFDFVVANPPFSSKAWSTGFNPAEDLYNRFADGVPPAKNGDYAFLLHIIRSLKSTGKGAIILPHGVLFRGNAEGEIRKKVIQKGYIEGIIGLPPNLFYGTSIPACILVINKENADRRKGIFMINASKGFVKDGNKNRLRHQDIHKIVDVFTKQIEIPKYSRMVKIEDEIKKNDFNLNIPRYIDSSEPEDIQDIEAHLKGDIPNQDIENLDHYWKVYPSLKKQLFSASQRKGYSKLKVEPTKIKNVIYTHPEFFACSNEIKELFQKWQTTNRSILKNIVIKPKVLIETLSETLLQTFANVHLLEKYDVYQHLMDYWTETMQDDVYMIMLDGYKTNIELIPSQIMIDRYFVNEQKNIDQLETDKNSITSKKEELEEANIGEEGILEELKNDKGKLSKGAVQKRLKELKNETIQGFFNSQNAETKEERELLGNYLDLLEKETDATNKIKEAKALLDKKINAKYSILSESEIKTLVVDDKWMATLEKAIQTEMDRISQRLTQRIKELAERYETPLSKQATEVTELENKVSAHLQKMGFTWK
ncbi:MAG: type I restriction-modification system subunit M [Planctomycetota bacterium]